LLSFYFFSLELYKYRINLDYFELKTLYIGAGESSPGELPHSPHRGFSAQQVCQGYKVCGEQLHPDEKPGPSFD
jgi:hypothetical protein